MDAKQIKMEIDSYNNCDTQRSWIMTGNTINYSNQYIDVIRLDSSNKWIDANRMIKMWSIIVKLKRDFTRLDNFIALQKEIPIEVTPVQKGKNAGAYGIRIRNMHRDPDGTIVRKILDFIFT